MFKFRRSTTLLSALFSLLGLLSPQSAQSQVTVVSQATVNATIANGVSCTGSPQTFTTAQLIPNFRNIGQTSHLATATSGASQFTMEIDGIDNLGNVFRLSDLQVGVPSSAKGGLVLTANGSMTNIQIMVTCSAGSTFSVSYSGSFSPTPTNTAGVLLSAVDKLPFQTAPANANSSTTFQSPTGNSSGTIIFQYAATGPSGSTVAATCLSNAGVILASYSFLPTTAATPQLFNVTAGTCPFVTLAYTSGGASATTYNLEYVFNQTGTVNVIADPCLSASVAKQSAPVPLLGTSGTEQIISAIAGKTVYVCAMNVTATWNSTNFTFQWEYGTGASCATGTTALSGTYSLVNANITSYAVTGPSLFNIPQSNGFCLTLTGGGGTSEGVAGFVTYIQQ